MDYDGEDEFKIRVLLCNVLVPSLLRRYGDHAVGHYWPSVGLG